MNADIKRLHSPDSEQAVLGALLLDPSSSDRIGALRPDHFFSDANRMILNEIMSMIAHGRPVDVITVAESLFESGVSEDLVGLSYLGDLASNSFGSSNIGRYAETVIGKALERQLLAASESIRETVFSTGTTREKLTIAQSSVMSISEAVANRAPRAMREVLTTAAEVLEQRSLGKVLCTPTGFIDLDAQLSGGLRPGNVIVVAGRPAMGKTALAVNIAFQVAQEGIPSLVISMEMDEQEVADRLIAQAGSVDLSDVIAGNMNGDSGERIMAGVSKLHDIPLIIDDQGGLTLFDVASKARSVKRKHGLGLMVIDYLQLMSGEGDSRNQQVDSISRGLKALAKELDIPIIVLSQLSRKCEERPNKRPMPSDLRDSGAIEQDADVILFVYRDEVYNPDTPDKGTAEVIVSKNRQGSTGMVRMVFQGRYTRFGTIAPGWKPDYSNESKDSKPRPRRRGIDGY